MTSVVKRRRVGGAGGIFKTEEDVQLLDVLRRDPVDETGNIVLKETIDYLPHVRSFNENDEIRITLNHKDAYTLPCDSLLILEGRVVNASDGTTPSTAKFVNNGFAHLFSEIRYEMNGVVVDIVRKPGIATTMKGAASLSRIERQALAHSGWTPDDTSDTANDWLTQTSTGEFSGWVKLSTWSGFFEDHRRVVYGVTQELVLVRGRRDADCLKDRGTGPAVNAKIVIENVAWRMPHVQVDAPAQTYLSRVIAQDRPIPIDFMRWELHENPNVLKTKQHTWSVRATVPTKIPQHVMIAFQTARGGNLKANCSEFDHCHLRSMKLFVNDVQYPYRDLKATWRGDSHPELYHMFQAFDPVYNKRHPQSAVTRGTLWDKTPIVVFDCSNHPRPVLDSTLDLKIEWECTEDVPDKTSVYALLLYRVAYHYHPLTTIVREVVE